MKFNPEITLGTVILILTVASSALAVFWKVVGSIDTLRENIKGELTLLRQILHDHNDRVDRLERRHEERMKDNESKTEMLREDQKKLTVLVQYVVGQNEERVRWDGAERRHGNEPRRR